ncbi:MAG: adenosine deaminase, partial [Erysipelotrichaceae bacterium]|nr:adenosine deaminase [Erysipelotrichaceae bacterium]
YENPELSRYCADHEIALVICPTSNVQCKTRESYPMHPAYNRYSLGVPVTINTDNMTMAGVTLDDEYDHCIREMGFEYEDLILMNMNSVKYSFLKDDEKKELLVRLEQCLDEIV